MAPGGRRPLQSDRPPGPGPPRQEGRGTGLGNDPTAVGGVRVPGKARKRTRTSLRGFGGGRPRTAAAKNGANSAQFRALWPVRPRFRGRKGRERFSPDDPEAGLEGNEIPRLPGRPTAVRGPSGRVVFVNDFNGGAGNNFSKFPGRVRVTTIRGQKALLPPNKPLKRMAYWPLYLRVSQKLGRTSAREKGE